jgi:hypothetical protein
MFVGRLKGQFDNPSALKRHGLLYKTAATPCFWTGLDLAIFLIQR